MTELATREPEISRASLLNRTMQNIREAWREVADWRGGLLSTAPSPNLPEKDVEAMQAQMRDCLEGRGGEVSARARAANLGRIYLSLNAQGRKRFLQILATEFDIDRKAVDKAAAKLQQAGENAEDRAKAERALRQALQPPRLRLLTQFNALPEGFHFLVDLRAELLSWRKEDPALAALERDLLSLLVSWFDVGFLELRRITWDSPASLLEKMFVYEKVHQIKSWGDLKNRLSSDRRCFAFFHPRMPNEPLIIVQVALVNGIADNIQTLLDETAPVLDPQEADTAIFYSISNAHEGLSSISFGNFLIKRVVDELATEFKNLKTFATLSPIPGFRHWLDNKMKELDSKAEAELLTATDRKALALAAGTGNEPASLQTLLQTPDWYQKPDLAKALKNPLRRLCARYLAKEKRDSGSAYDRVANFHLTNGSRIERLNWLADTSANGLKQSAGMMVNYLYKLDDIETNHEVYRGEGKVITSSSIKTLLKG
ncbi:MAG TPA: malonyl-CoA decarboxylase [Candidatus Competibacteraceae bacterium]|nr:MAG: malonyl-CoA decarboxylase [Candidatus Competibacteraceae bacterium]HOB60727.1 malonyl-CoA decarboxylase [Candidatus Competibacteraceae bacterium]HQA24858.1 malonyl-CoA decarboxylase [Candidatus Competibacteraceae bacterium]HQD55716.1 malonyl-CoA decarboxylase [Candidatus Competibacteraceae bacterium]